MKNLLPILQQLILPLSLLITAQLTFGQASDWKINGNTNTDSSCFMGTTTAQPLNFRTDNQNRMVITSDGKLGIGTKTPAADLTVAGSVQFEFLTGSDTRAVLADMNGNLIPASLKPSPGGNDPSYCGQLSWTGAGNYIQSDCYLGTNNQEDLVIKTAGFEKMRITVDGKLGILQSNPLARLHVGMAMPLTFSQQTGHNTLGFNCYRNGLNGPLTQIGAGPAAFLDFLDAQGILHLSVSPDQGSQLPLSNGLNGIFLTQTGNVGIGNSNPQALLHISGDSYLDGNARVDGQVCARRVTVHEGNGICWPDYVFAENYTLMPLESLEEYLKQNQHLPGLPTAVEVETEGFEVGDMTRSLLEKVEELTLYMIELNHENELLKAEVAKLKRNSEMIQK